MPALYPQRVPDGEARFLILGNQEYRQSWNDRRSDAQAARASYPPLSATSRDRDADQFRRVDDHRRSAGPFAALGLAGVRHIGDRDLPIGRSTRKVPRGRRTSPPALGNAIMLGGLLAQAAIKL